MVPRITSILTVVEYRSAAMTYQNLKNQFRLQRGNFAVLARILCVFGAVAAWVGAFICFIDLIDFQNLHGKPAGGFRGGPICLLSWIGFGFLLIAGLIHGLLYRSIWYTQEMAHALKAYLQGNMPTADQHARAAWHYAQLFAVDDPRRGKTLQQLTLIAHNLGNYDDAESFGRACIDAQTQAWGDEHFDAANANLDLAKIYLEIARYPQARTLLEKSRSLLDRDPTHQPIALAICLGLMGRLHFELNELDRAESYLRRAHTLMQPHAERISECALAATFLFSAVCTKNGKWDEAELILNATGELIDKTRPRASWQHAYVLPLWASLRCAQGRHTEAEELERQGLAELEVLFGTAVYPWLIGIWASLGNILAVQNKTADSESFYLRAIESCDRYCAPEHPQIAGILEDYAGLLERMGRLDEADRLLHRAHQIRDYHSPLRIV